jgi:ligand-binding SRPBCC domain-containing protein
MPHLPDFFSGVIMPIFNYSFTVKAPLAQVSDFHHNTAVLKLLTPPPIFAQIHAFEPLGEGSKARFTLWFGPVPIQWEAVHNNVDQNGFTDTQVRGPLKRWHHTHRFIAINDSTTSVDEHIEYEHHAGLKGLVSRLLFSRLALIFLFTARMLITRRHLQRDRKRAQAAGNERPTR